MKLPWEQNDVDEAVDHETAKMLWGTSVTIHSRIDDTSWIEIGTISYMVYIAINAVPDGATKNAVAFAVGSS